MKLQSNKKKKITVAIIIAVALVLIAAAIIIGLMINKFFGDRDDGPAYVVGTVISIYPKTEYYVGEEFDPTGTLLLVSMSNDEESFTVDHTKLTFEGFDSSVPNDKLAVKVSYKEYSTTMYVKIKEAPSLQAPKLVSIRLSDNFVTAYSLGEWNFYGPAFGGINIICTYSDGSEVEVPMAKNYWANRNDMKKLDSAGTYEMIVWYVDQGIEATSSISITITE